MKNGKSEGSKGLAAGVFPWCQQTYFDAADIVVKKKNKLINSGWLYARGAADLNDLYLVYVMRKQVY
jgi:hypothetical protein|uniref:Uncharacterized protein n=1 Tax=Oryza sativa subsp. japonica TaxID=39947 RepID=Q6ZGF7_ORYSJ|nr:hypothetical protein [Oryza sativa Japonica Group]BAD37643.1 hypothetical protein [Oryza sativa Japonica Group]